MKISFQTGDAPGNERPPLRVLLLADLAASRAPTHPFVLAEPADLPKLLVELAPELLLEVPNRLGGAPSTFEVRLHLGSLRDLQPEAVAEQLPDLAPLRRFLEQVGGQAAGSAELEQALAPFAGVPALEEPLRICRSVPPPAAPSPAAPPSTTPGDASVDRILDLVSAPPPEARAASAIGAIVGVVGRGRRAPAAAPGSPVQQALRLVAARVGEQLDAVMHHPELQRVEAAWRGLKLLVDRTDFRRGIRLEVLPVARPRAGDPLLEQVLDETTASYDLLFAAYAFDNPATDAELVQWLGERAEALQAPLVFSLGAGFFGLTDPAGAAELRYPGTLFEQPQYTKWNALRDKDCARWLAGLHNRFLLRPPHAPAKDAPRRELLYSEGISRPADHLWGDPVWLVASLVVRSFAECGWPTEISGTTGGRIDDLSVRTVQLAGRGAVELPLEAALSQQLVQDLAQLGVSALFAPENSDAAFLLYTPTLFRIPEQQGVKPRRGRIAALPYQLLAARLAQAVAGFKVQLAGLSTEEMRQRLSRFVYDLVGETGGGASVDVQINRDPEQASRVIATVETHMGKGVLGGATVELNFLLAG